MERRAITCHSPPKKRVVYLSYTNLRLNSANFDGSRYSLVYMHIYTFMGAGNSGPLVPCFEEQVGIKDSLNPDFIYNITLIKRAEDENPIEFLIECIASTNSNRTILTITPATRL